MRFFNALIITLLPALTQAQPGLPALLVVLAEDRQALRPLEREVEVLQFFRDRQAYINADGSWLGPERSLPIQHSPLMRDTTEHWVVNRPMEGMAVSYLLVTSGSDTMRLDLQEVSTRLQERAMLRKNGDSPEVIRFCHGRFDLESLAFDKWSTRAAERIAEDMIRDELKDLRRSQRARQR